MRIAIIDCGTNTFNLLIAEKTGPNVEFIFEDKIPVKIGKGGIENKIITQDAYLRALEAMRSYAFTIQQYNVEKVIATSTSAFRTTDNGPKLRDEILRATGIHIEIISGDQEAEYIYQGVTWAYPPEKDKTYLIMDIGGGSTEFILYDAQKIHYKASYLLGASRLLEKFKPNDPLSAKDIETYFHYFNEVLGDSLIKACREYQPEILVGSSGFFDTLRKICYYKFHNNDPALVEQLNCDIRLPEFNACYELMLPLNEEERLKIQGMTPFRAEMMVVSILLVDYIIKHTGVQLIVNTQYALKEGVLRDQFGQ
jgi:exopolyphosphatase/guanosine-5'-triphosphate,3'-diphosphate pyrophosphatase